MMSGSLIGKSSFLYIILALILDNFEYDVLISPLLSRPRRCAEEAPGAESEDRVRDGAEAGSESLWRAPSWMDCSLWA